MDKNEKCEGHRKYMGTKLLVIGILVILNEVYATVTWPMFVGIVLALLGLKVLLLCKKK